MHRETAKHCASGNCERAERFAISAAGADTVANRHAAEALALYRHHGDQVAERAAETAAEEAAKATGTG